MTTVNKPKFCAISALICAICVSVAGCGNPTALAAVVAASDAALVSLTATKTIPASDAVAALAYIDSVSTAAAQSSTELASADAPAVQDAKILGYWASVAYPHVSAQTADIILATQSAVAAFLAAYQPQRVAAPAIAPRAVSARSAGHSLSNKEKSALAKLRRKALGTAAEAALLRAQYQTH